MAAPQLNTALEDHVEAHLPFSVYTAPGVVNTRSGDYMSTWSIDGLSFEGLSEGQTLARMDGLNLLIRGLSNGQFAFWVHRIRRGIRDRLSSPATGFSHDLLEKYYQGLENGGLMATEIYLTVVFRPHPQKNRSLFPLYNRSIESASREIAHAVETLHEMDRQIASSLQAYGPQRLSDYEWNDKRHSTQLEFYGYLCNGHWWRVAVKNVPLYSYLPVSRHLFGDQIMETRDALGSTFSCFLDLKDYAQFTSPGILNSLLGLRCEYVETQSFSPLAKADALSALKLQRNQLISAQDDSVRQIVDMDEAMEGVVSGTFALGEYHYVLQLKGATPQQAKDARASAIEALQYAGFLPAAIDGVIDHAFWSHLPTQWKHRPRSAKLSSRNFVGLASLHNFASGKRSGNPWGEALTILKTPASQPFYFNFHVTPMDEDAKGTKPLANTQIIGQSGGGKTVLALFLEANASKYGARVVYFDKDRGAEIAIRARGGSYLCIERGVPSGFAPFKLEPTLENQLFWEDLVKFCAASPQWPLSPTEEADIHNAILALAALPQAVRSFEAVRQNLPQTDPNGPAARLAKWCRCTGALGWALDGQLDRLTINTDTPTGFDYTDLLDDAKVCPAVMMYLMYRVECAIDGHPFIFFMDEYWKALSDPVFEKFVKDKQKTIRKQNGLGVYMTQSPSDTLQSPIARALIEQTATFIFLPNPTADRIDYVEGFKLSEAEYQIVKGLPEGSRMFLIKQGATTTVAMLDLKGFEKELQVLSGTTDNVVRLDRLRARLGDAPEAWLPTFLAGGA
jgi:type IV secretion system protein VirB4